MTIEQVIIAIFTTLVINIPTYLLMKGQREKLRAESNKSKSETLHEDASAAEIFQKIATEEALSKSQTIASMQKQIDDLIKVVKEYETKINDLNIALTSEQSARRDLEATVVRLNNDLAEARKELAEERAERLTAIAELENLKDWAEKLVSLLRAKNIPIPPYPNLMEKKNG